MPSPQQLRKRIEVKAQVLSCNRCPLHLSCKAPVPFRGPSPNRIVVLGEAPGQEEDAQGKPFVGPAGRFLSATMEEAGIDPVQVSYLNTVSCYPSGTPTKHHRERCHKNLVDQLRVLEPEYILVLGSIAVSSWWDIKITTMRSQWWRLPEPSLTPPLCPRQTLGLYNVAPLVYPPKWRGKIAEGKAVLQRLSCISYHCRRLTVTCT